MKEVWVVTSSTGSIVCDIGMRLSRHAAENKVENEKRIGWHMIARPANDQDFLRQGIKRRIEES